MENLISTIIIAASMIAIAIIDVVMIPREFKKGNASSEQKEKS